MKESFWAAYIVSFGIIAIVFIFLFQSLTNSDEHNMAILKETTEASMFDAFDYATYRASGEIRIDREKFVEVFLRRFSENASLSRNYHVEIYDVNEKPPKVSIKVSSRQVGQLFTIGGGKTAGGTVTFTISNRIDAILEVPY